MNWDRRLQAAVIMIAVALVFFAGFKYALWQSERHREEQQGLVVSADNSEGTEKEIAETPMFAVHVAGAVKNPGVFYFPQGSRINDAVKKAGLLAEADVDQLNLAALIYDGEKIYVPKKGEQLPSAIVTGSNTGMPSVQGKININTASSTELETLPGIGPVLAERIIEYRELSGPFQAIEDLGKVTGFGTKRIEQIKELVTI